MDSPIFVIGILLLLVAGAAGAYVWRQRAAAPVATPAPMDAAMPRPKVGTPKKSTGKTTSVGMMATLEILAGPDAYVEGMNAGKKVEIYSGRVRIGRSSDLCDLQLYNIDDNSTVSRQHCTIEFDEVQRKFWLTDDESRSGTFVGGEQIKAREPLILKDGDVIDLGIVDQRGARLRFSTPMGRAQRPGAAEIVETDAVNVAAVQEYQEEPALAQLVEVDEPVDPEKLPGVTTLQVHHPHDIGKRGGTGPLGSNFQQCDIFLSYSRRDREMMLQITADLLAAGLSVWTDENLTPGTPIWRQSIEGAIETSKCLVVILSPDAKQSSWVQRELDYAMHQTVPIMPLLVRGDERTAVPLTLISAQWADLREDYVNKIQRAIEVIQQMIDSGE